MICVTVRRVWSNFAHNHSILSVLRRSVVLCVVVTCFVRRQTALERRGRTSVSPAQTSRSTASNPAPTPSGLLTQSRTVTVVTARRATITLVTVAFTVAWGRGDPQPHTSASNRTSVQLIASHAIPSPKIALSRCSLRGKSSSWWISNDAAAGAHVTAAGAMPSESSSAICVQL